MPRLLPAVLICILAVTAQAGTFTREMEFDTDVLKVADLVGAIELRPATDGRFHVKVTVQGDDADPSVIGIEQEAGALRVVFPVGKQRRFVYPRLDKKKASFHQGMDNDRQSWWRRILDAADGKRITVVRNGRGFRAWADLEIAVPAGSRLEVVHGAGSITARDLRADVVCELRYGPVTVTGLEGSFHGGTGSGTVTCRQVTGDVHVDAGSGSVVASGCRGEHFHADAGSGTVSVKDLDVSLLEIDTGSGSVEGSGLGADEGRIETGSGDIVADFRRLGEDWFRFETGSGDIDLGLPEGAEATVEAATGSGRVTFDLPAATVQEQGRRTARLVLGKGTSRVKLETGSGDIRIHH